MLRSQYHYLSLGCSKRAENVMLTYAKTLIGKPFSNVGMARSIVYPRTTDQTSFFCAELVACILQRGGLMCAAFIALYPHMSLSDLDFVIWTGLRHPTLGPQPQSRSIDCTRIRPR